MTLRQGLEIFRKDYQIHLTHNKEHTSTEAITFFNAHDIAHVIFDCDISFYGEGAVKLWTIFGTTLGFWNHIKGYRSAEAFSLSKKFTIRDLINDLPKLILITPKIIRRASRMSKPWPWEYYEDYLDQSIVSIREEFNIRTL